MHNTGSAEKDGAGIMKKSKDNRNAIMRKLDSFEIYLKENEHAQMTVDKYVRDVRLFLSFAGSYDTVDKLVMLSFKEWLWKNYAASSCNSMISSVNRYLDFLGMNELKIKGFRQQKQVFASDSLMTLEEYHRLLQAARDLKNERLALCMQTIFLTGARVGELRYFTVEAVSRGKVLVRNKGKIRSILIPDILRTLLLSYADQTGIASGPVFVTRYGQPLDRSNLWREMQQLQVTANVSGDKIHPHNLRHLFARTYYRMTSDVVGLSDILGHSSLDVTRIYTNGTEENYRKDLNRMTMKTLKK